MDKLDAGLMVEINHGVAMTYCLNASHVFFHYDGYMVVLGFSDDEFEPKKFIILQKTHGYDEQDERLGMNNIHVQIEDASRSKYGGIKAVQTGERFMRIVLFDDAKSILAVDGDIKIISVDNFYFKEAKSELKKMCEAEKIEYSELG